MGWNLGVPPSAQFCLDRWELGRIFKAPKQPSGISEHNFTLHKYDLKYYRNNTFFIYKVCPNPNECSSQISVVSSTGSLEALNSAEIDAEYDNAAAASNGLEEERPPHSLDVTSCYGHAPPGGNSGPVSLPIGFGRRGLASKKK